MFALNLHVIWAKDVHEFPLTIGGHDIPRIFADASSNELDITVRSHPYTKDSVKVTSDWLHKALRAFIDPATIRPVHDIALIMCRSWLLPQGSSIAKVYGVMFDHDGDFPGLGSFTSMDVPREAAAVFRDEHTSNDDAVFTAVHELGHVFNLIHKSSPPSYMTRAVFAPAEFRDDDKTKLKLAGQEAPIFGNRHLPGMDPFLDTPASTRLRTMGRSGTRAPVSLRCSLAQRSFLIGEPVVLDVKLSASRGGQLIRPPADFDPAYPEFQVWYETPIGEVRLFRPGLHICRSAVSKFAPRVTAYSHNPRIHLGADGLEFTQPGRYRVWVEYHGRVLGRRRALISTPRRFEVREPSTKLEMEIVSALLSPAAPRLIASKRGAVPKKTRAVLEAAVDAAPNHPAVRHIRYALASADFEAGHRESCARLTRRWRDEGTSIDAGVMRLKKTCS